MLTWLPKWCCVRNPRHNTALPTVATSGSICDAIVTPSPGKLTFPIMKRLCGPGLAVPDEDCLRAMAAAFLRLKIVLEPGGAIDLGKPRRVTVE